VLRHALVHGASRIPGLKRLPVLKLLAIGEIAVLAHRHVRQLGPGEARRLVDLLRKARGRPRNLSEPERQELARIVQKLEPRAFAGDAADKLSPVPLPGRLKYGPKRR
jgi:hypothetical protein